MKNYLKPKRKPNLMKLKRITFLRGINTSNYSLIVSALVNVANYSALIFDFISDCNTHDKQRLTNKCHERDQNMRARGLGSMVEDRGLDKSNSLLKVKIWHMFYYWVVLVFKHIDTIIILCLSKKMLWIFCSFIIYFDLGSIHIKACMMKVIHIKACMMR